MRRARYRRARRSGGARDARRSNEAAGRRRRKLAGASAPTDADDDATARRRRNRAGSQWARSVAPRGTRGDTKETRRAPRPQSERLQDVERDRGCARALRIAARRARSFLPSLARSSRFSSPRERSIDRAKSLRNGVHHANGVVWGPVYRSSDRSIDRPLTVPSRHPSQAAASRPRRGLTS